MSAIGKGEEAVIRTSERLKAEARAKAAHDKVGQSLIKIYDAIFATAEPLRDIEVLIGLDPAERARRKLSTQARMTVLIFATPALIAVRSLAAALIWGWFVVPRGFPSLSVLVMAGLQCGWMAFLPPRVTARDFSPMTDEEFWQSLKGQAVIPLSLLAQAWLLAQFL